MLSKKHPLIVGNIYAIPLSDDSFTIAQLINVHEINSKSSEDTYAFFSIKLESIDDVKAQLDKYKLTDPFSIVTANSSPWKYNWILIEKKDILIDKSFKEKIGSLGLYKNYSTDPSIFIEPYFGLFPWDGYYKDDYLDKHIIPQAKEFGTIKYLKDFTNKQLKELLPKNSPKLIKRLKES